jgi:hypothetical protein
MERINKVLINAKNKLDYGMDKAKAILSRKEKGLDQVVIILIIIAVAAGVIGLGYNLAKKTTNSVSETTNGNITKWFSDAAK